MTETKQANGPSPVANSIPTATEPNITLLAREIPNALSDTRVSPSMSPQERRRQRIALVEEFGGTCADLKKAAQEAIQRGMYSPRTNRGDIESSLLRTWKHRHRDYQR
jgi:hypothetical protein